MKKWSINYMFRLLPYAKYLEERINSKWGYNSRIINSSASMVIIEVFKKNYRFYVKLNLEGNLLSIKVSEKLESSIINAISKAAGNYFSYLMTGRVSYRMGNSVKILDKLQNLVCQYTDEYTKKYY